jgi:hypothetical protein
LFFNEKKVKIKFDIKNTNSKKLSLPPVEKGTEVFYVPVVIEDTDYFFKIVTDKDWSEENPILKFSIVLNFNNNYKPKDKKEIVLVGSYNQETGNLKITQNDFNIDDKTIIKAIEDTIDFDLSLPMN